MKPMPVVRRLMGHSEVFAPRIRAALTEPFAGGPDVTTVVPVEVDDGRATPVGRGMRALVRANGLAGGGGPPPGLSGDEVTVMMLETPG